MTPKTKEKYLQKIKDDPCETGLHPLQILIDIDGKGYDQIKLSAKIGKSQAAISQVISRKSRSVFVMGKIADIIEKSFLEVWGMTEEESKSKKKV